MRLVKESLENLFEYQIEETTAAATYYLAEMYYDFSLSMLKSERPDDLNAMEKEQYELSIEEQAFPFEEKAIQVHEKNLELLKDGIFNEWIEKSVMKLAVLVPARYGRLEESSGYIREIDGVDYNAIINPVNVESRDSQAISP